MNDRQKLVDMEQQLGSLVMSLMALKDGLSQYLRGAAPAPTPTPTPEPVPVPAPAPAPAPSPTKPVVNYGLWVGKTRAQIESPYGLGKWPNANYPAGWNWDDAFAAGITDVYTDDGGGGSGFNPWTHRDLTGTHGNVLKMEGPAGSSAVFTLREPVGKRLAIKAFRVPSNFGACEKLELRVQNQVIVGGGSDAQATAYIVSTGNDPVTVTLRMAGGAGVQLNPG